MNNNPPIDNESDSLLQAYVYDPHVKPSPPLFDDNDSHVVDNRGHISDHLEILSSEISNRKIHEHLASDHFLKNISRDFAREYSVLSQGHHNGIESLFIGGRCRPDVTHNIGVRLGCSIEVHSYLDEDVLLASIDAAYERYVHEHDDELNEKANEGTYVIGDTVDAEIDFDADNSDLLSSTGKAPMVLLVDRLLFRAARHLASDIHIQPLTNALIVRNRIDGVLDTGRQYDLAIHKSLVSRIKVMGRMDVAERLIPQDGRCSIRIGNRNIDLRISSIPSMNGERIVLRLLDTQNQVTNFSQLGMPQNIASAFLNAAKRSSGIILVTGPTGSGKSTTLYAILRELNAPERNIMTIEDPVEYNLSEVGLSITQSQVNEKKGMTFANGLRHLLRQDPDIIMVGEIRDLETARMAIQSSLTGHLVLSTLHTNDALSAITRLIDLGVETYLVAASLTAVLAQRLLRRSCITCGGVLSGSCETCNNTGFRGRLGIYEMVVITEDIQHLITSGVSLSELRLRTKELGIQSLRDCGMDLVRNEVTTKEELERVIHA